MLVSILNYASEYLLIVMGTVLSVALVVRFIAFRCSRNDSSYYSSFTGEVQNKIYKDSEENLIVVHIDEYISNLMKHTKDQLPERKLRGFNRKKEVTTQNRFSGSTASNVRDYIGGSNSLVHGILSEMTIFKGHHPPDFAEVTKRVMDRDLNWVKLYGLLSIDKISRMIDALPGIFIITGIFGTFLGISNALPQIANIDFQNVAGSSDVLGAFVLEITFAMKTSIAGILCSLCITLINILFPLARIRDEISSKVESTLENLWYFLQADTQERKREQSYDKMVRALESIAHKFEEINIDAIDNIKTKKSA
jgi:hypothetical protein